jgi:pimeloyl-ACP methyl ester carboxylesterase
VEVRGQTLAVRCEGRGPLVVLLSGQGVPAVSWAEPVPAELQAGVMWRPPFGARQPVQPALAGSARVCVYDRPGLGSSAALRDATPRRVEDAVDDLHALLAKLSPGEKVVLAGHSLGGLIAFEYARAHPERVAGLVLVDATHPDEGRRLAWLMPQPTPEQYARAVARHPEHLDTRPATTRGADAVPAGVLGDLPLVVLTRTQGLGADDARAFGAPPTAGLAARWRRDVWGMATEYASASSAGRLVTAAESGHFIVFDQPDLVRDAVTEVLREVGARGGR